MNKSCISCRREQLPPRAAEQQLPRAATTGLHSKTNMQLITKRLFILYSLDCVLVVINFNLTQCNATDAVKNKVNLLQNFEKLQTFINMMTNQVY